ncbi:hypothetical protein GCM10010168_91230 [Actinoplanes ianthinogenes]|uniref:Peptidase MA-like domain-containing protein n=1 Tax=Actinoplanes ianthinogenes TaxID=122358 RepID=A0ABN6CHI3_9ACTN|nr:hypothetical protein [Actinoplanes ianthinogenes]BCJ43834.1 hypothetical protein Aiant_44910 [Actinoplanes ianthinogenes]GGR58144.1 hypothetical protein GCM10010168_91230 [Actinoplanes ianthinogenes]
MEDPSYPGGPPPFVPHYGPQPPAWPPAFAPQPPPKRSHTTGILAALAAVLLAAAAAAVIFWPDRDETAKADAAGKPTRPATPFESALEALHRQAEALVKGDEKGWLAPVDPANKALVTRYRTMFTNLRSLEISHAEFHADKLEGGTAEKVVTQAALGYCFSGVSCPAWRNNYDEGPAKATYRVTFTLAGTTWRITEMNDAAGVEHNYLQPAPWDNRELTFVKGKRVIVAGPRSQAKRLKQVLALSEKAAQVTDKYAGFVNNAQRRYRVYLADEAGWKKWYGGIDQKWVIGYEMPLNATGGDVILRAKASADSRQLAVTVQHELTHVVTLAGGHWENTDDQWLVEGIAEYIGALPRGPQNTGNHDVLSESFRRRGEPKTIAVPPLSDDADDLTVNTLYAMGHYATACMADKFGEQKLMQFTDLVLRAAKKPDEASRTAYGKPFATVDKACLSWIRDRV